MTIAILDARKSPIAVLSVGVNTAEITRQLGLAETAAAASESSASFAEEFSGPAYATIAAGEAATTTGQFFRVSNGDTPRTYTRYERTAGGSVVASPLASTADLASTAAGKGAALVGQKATGAGAKNRTAAEVMDEFVYAAGFTGWDGTGATDSYAALMAADAVARSRNRPLIIQGRPNFTQPIFLDNPVHWILQGVPMRPGFNSPGTRLRKSQVIDGPGLVFRPGAINSVVDGGGLECGAGNGGDGVLILANGVTLRDFGVSNAGRDGIRIGEYAAGDTYANADTVVPNINANSWNLDNVAVGACGRDGLNIDDQGSIVTLDANAGVANRLISDGNGRYGLYAGRTIFGSTFTGPLLEANGDYGLYLGAESSGLVFVGGDIEVNNGGGAGGNVFEAVPGTSLIIGTTVQGVVWNNKCRTGGFTPTVLGSTSAGAGTYSKQLGRWSLNDGLVTFWVEIEWSAHTGTGSFYASLPPFAPEAASTTPSSVLANAALIDGTPVAGLISPAGNQLRMFNPTSFANMALPASGRLFASGSYEYSRPVASY